MTWNLVAHQEAQVNTNDVSVYRAKYDSGITDPLSCYFTAYIYFFF